MTRIRLSDAGLNGTFFLGVQAGIGTPEKNRPSVHAGRVTVLVVTSRCEHWDRFWLCWPSGLHYH